MIGYDEIDALLTNNFYENKLSHAIILHGKRGIGKASFAKSFCQKILNNFDEVNPDIKIIQKPEDKKVIGIDEVRASHKFLLQSSAKSAYKFTIIDSACDLTNQASNSLLKILEEPRNNNFLILIVHNFNKILPTIISRCQLFKINDLSLNNFNEILELKSINFSEENKLFLSEISENSPAMAIDFGNEIIKIYQEFLKSLLQNSVSEELIKMISDKKFNFYLIEKNISFFLIRLLKFNYKLINKLFFNEEEIFNLLISKHNNQQIINFSEEILSNLNNYKYYNLDKKMNFLNQFNQICYG